MFDIQKNVSSVERYLQSQHKNKRAVQDWIPNYAHSLHCFTTHLPTQACFPLVWKKLLRATSMVVLVDVCFHIERLWL